MLANTCVKIRTWLTCRSGSFTVSLFLIYWSWTFASWRCPTISVPYFCYLWRSSMFAIHVMQSSIIKRLRENHFLSNYTDIKNLYSQRRITLNQKQDNQLNSPPSSGRKNTRGLWALLLKWCSLIRGDDNSESLRRPLRCRPGALQLFSSEEQNSHLWAAGEYMVKYNTLCH